MGDHWSESFDSEGVDTNNREAFVTANTKYSTMEAAVVGGFNAQKIAGKPFKFPESMDKLPDDASRADFTSQARGLLGINVPKDVESLKDFDFKSGLAEGAEVDENFVSMVKSWAVEKGIPTAHLQEMAGFFNGPLAKYAQEAYATRQEKEKLANAEKCNTALVEHFKSEDNVKELTTLMHRTIVNKMGLSADESAECVDAMADSMLTKNPVMAKGMLNLLSQVSTEGTTLTGDGHGGGGDGKKQASPYEAKKARWPKSPDQWGDPSDKWDDESIGVRKQLGPKPEKT